MTQTLLALLALSLSSLLVFNQKQLEQRAQTRMVANELELAASGLGSEIIELIAARSFDEATTPGAIAVAGVVPTGASAFSPPDAAGAADRGDAGCDLVRPKRTPECDDVDDVDGLGWVTVQMDLSHGRTLPFDVRTRVWYVATSESEAAITVPTAHKRVTVDLRSPHLGSVEPITVTRVVSYDRIKAEYDFERVHGALGTAPLGTAPPGP